MHFGLLGLGLWVVGFCRVEGLDFWISRNGARNDRFRFQAVRPESLAISVTVVLVLGFRAKGLGSRFRVLNLVYLRASGPSP